MRARASSAARPNTWTPRWTCWSPERPAAVMSPVEFGGHELLLLPQKAALLVAERTLLVADAHFGKAASFRHFGVPVPRGTTGQTLEALSALVAAHAVRRIVFLG